MSSASGTKLDFTGAEKDYSQYELIELLKWEMNRNCRNNRNCKSSL